MAAFNLPRNAGDPAEVPVPPLAVPHFTVDGWTLAGTPLAGRIPRQLAGELTTLLHTISLRTETPWTYDRAAQILEECGQPSQALAVCEAWFLLAASHGPASKAKNRALSRRRHRLRARLAADLPGPA